MKALNLGKNDSASKEDRKPAWGSGPGSNSSTSAHQPRQKNVTSSKMRPGTAKTNNGKSAKNKRATEEDESNDDFGIEGHQIMSENNGAKIQKGSIRNNDICDELVISN